MAGDGARDLGREGPGVGGIVQPDMIDGDAARTVTVRLRLPATTPPGTHVRVALTNAAPEVTRQNNTVVLPPH